jgi:hypothetical protein
MGKLTIHFAANVPLDDNYGECLEIFREHFPFHQTEKIYVKPLTINTTRLTYFHIIIKCFICTMAHTEQNYTHILHNMIIASNFQSARKRNMQNFASFSFFVRLSQTRHRNISTAEQEVKKTQLLL